MSLTYEDLLLKADHEGVAVKEFYLHGSDGRIKGRRIAIRKDIETQVEKSCVLAEELGHYYTTAGNILDQGDVSNRKQELKARVWAYNNKIGLFGIVNAYEHGCTNSHEIAEYLDVTEEFLLEALQRYRNKYGICASVDNYIVYFIPNLIVVKVVSD